MSGQDELGHTSSPRPWINQRTARITIGVALVIKLSIVVWNAASYDNLPYDYYRHEKRAAAAGLRVGRVNHYPPL